MNLDHLQHDIRFVEDDWESPTLGAAGLGWEFGAMEWKLLNLLIFSKLEVSR